MLMNILPLPAFAVSATVPVGELVPIALVLPIEALLEVSTIVGALIDPLVIFDFAVSEKVFELPAWFVPVRVTPPVLVSCK